MKEIIRTSGDIRRLLGQAMIDIRDGDLSIAKGQCISQLAKEITSSLQVEVNVAKVRTAVLSQGKNMGDITRMGRLLIEDEGDVPTLSGAAAK